MVKKKKHVKSTTTNETSEENSDNMLDVVDGQEEITDEVVDDEVDDVQTVVSEPAIKIEEPLESVKVAEPMIEATEAVSEIKVVEQEVKVVNEPVTVENITPVVNHPFVVPEIKPKTISDQKQSESVTIPRKTVTTNKERTVSMPAQQNKSEVPETLTYQRMKAQLDKYKVLISNKVNGDVEKKQITTIFVTIMDLMISTSERKVFELVYNFFLTNKNAMLRPEVALGSFTRYSDPDKARKLVSFYTIISSLISSKLMKTAFTLNTDAISSVLDNRELINWLITKR